MLLLAFDVLLHRWRRASLRASPGHRLISFPPSGRPPRSLRGAELDVGPPARIDAGARTSPSARSRGELANRQR
jgi:hypothetical protein